MRYIDADSLLIKIKAYRPYMYLGEDALSYAIKMVELEPSADVRENVHGGWIDEHEDGHGWWVGRCNKCGKENRLSKFCPNCGADMRGEDHGKI